MHLPSILLALITTASATASTISDERPYFCPLSLDVKMMQYPFCCEGFVPARDSKVSMEGVDCIDIRKNEDFVSECPRGGTPKCCYPIGKSVICTTEVESGEIV